ncbi:MAG: hypothetical protein K2J67_11595 [Lachnospiraceae bacterium]|nr:hypothetical protein [Lachnospiraceae bacterium]
MADKLYPFRVSQEVYDLAEYLRNKEEITRKVFTRRAIQSFLNGSRDIDEKILISNHYDPEYIFRDVLFSVLIGEDQLDIVRSIASKKGCKVSHVLFQSLVGYCVQLVDPEDGNINIE